MWRGPTAECLFWARAARWTSTPPAWTLARQRTSRAVGRALALDLARAFDLALALELGRAGRRPGCGSRM
eukprot:9361463-Pyramimonas_sp.AAC.1